jgi:hypothetical protein
MVFMLLFVCYAASDNFPTTEGEWWAESSKHVGWLTDEAANNRSLRIKAECINMRIQQILGKMSLSGIPNYDGRFYSTGRNFWTTDWGMGGKTFEDSDKMLALIYDQLVYIDDNLGGNSNSGVVNQPWRKW